MQAIKDKLNDMKEMRHAKAEAKEVEKAEKEMGKARVEVAHEVRMAREAEAAMDLHVHKAVEKAAENERKHHPPSGGAVPEDTYTQESYGRNPNSPETAYSTNPMHAGMDSAGARAAAFGGSTGCIDDAATTTGAGTGYAGSRSGGPPTNNSL